MKIEREREREIERDREREWDRMWEREFERVRERKSEFKWEGKIIIYVLLSIMRCLFISRQPYKRQSISLLLKKSFNILELQYLF